MKVLLICHLLNLCFNERERIDKEFKRKTSYLNGPYKTARLRKYASGLYLKSILTFLNN